MNIFEISVDLSVKDDNLNNIPNVQPDTMTGFANALPAHSLPTVEIQGINGGSVETSDCGRHKRTTCQIGALNRCLCGVVVNPDINLVESVQCKQAGCETQWVCSLLI